MGQINIDTHLLLIKRSQTPSCFLPCIVLKRIKLRQAVAIKTENWDPQISQKGREMTVHRLLVPTWTPGCGGYREDGEVNASSVFRQGTQTLWETFKDVWIGTQLAGGVDRKGSSMITLFYKEPGVQLKPEPASRWQLIVLSFSPLHISWPDSYPIVLQWSKKQQSICVWKGAERIQVLIFKLLIGIKKWGRKSPW